MTPARKDTARLLVFVRPVLLGIRELQLHWLSEHFAKKICARDLVISVS